MAIGGKGGWVEGPSGKGRVWLPGWSKKWTKPGRYKSAKGGRGSGKTWAVATLLVLRAVQQKTRIACCREFQASIKVSAKPALEIAIHRLGLDDYFTINKQTIDCYNGSHFFFSGMERNRESIRGWEDVDIVWVEEAQRMSHATAKVLLPTIRKAGSELWFTWNPEDRADWAWERFVVQYDPAEPGVISDHVNYDSNAFFPDEANRERIRDKTWQPELYNHIWLGEPNDAGGESNLIPYKLLEACVEGYRQGLWKGVSETFPWESGLDIADQGVDWNALTMRQGPVIDYWLRWRADDPKETCLRAHGFNRDRQISRMMYDAGGHGAPVRVFLREIQDRGYAVRPELFGGKVKGEKARFSYRLTNGQFFARRNIQMGWDLKLRAMRTERLLKGDADMRPERCLFINPKPPTVASKWQPSLDSFLNELNQPTWRNNPTTGKSELNKREEDEPSPDMYDSAALAFAYGSRNGLKDY